MSLLLDISRFATYAAALQLFGVAAFQFALAPAGLRRALDRQARAVAVPGAILALLGAVAWLMATAGSMGEGWADATSLSTIGTVLSATAFGRVWTWVLLFALAATALALFRGGRWTGLTVASTLLLCALALVGHSAMVAGPLGLVNRLSQVLHLLSSAFWLGSLVPLIFCLRAFGDASVAAEAEAALRRFSGLGHYAVAILLLSGVANSWFVLSGTGIDLSAPYQQGLAIKIVLAGTMVMLAVINRYFFMPRIPNGGPGLRLLIQGSIAEIVLGALILGLVSVIGTLPPGPMPG